MQGGRLKKKREQKGFEERLLRAILSEEDDQGACLEATEDPQDPCGARYCEPTPQQRAAFQELLGREVKRIQQQKRYEIMVKARRRAAMRRGLGKVAVILLFLTVFAGTTLYYTDEAFAAGINRFISRAVPDDGAEELRIEEKKDGEAVKWNKDDFEGMYFPNWIPRGYTLQRVIIGENEREIYYANKQGDEICYTISQKQYSVIVNDENVEEKAVYLHNSQGRMITTDEVVHLVWEENGYTYRVFGNSDMKEELIEMIKKCTLIEGDNR